jgi:hypothetical protein
LKELHILGESGRALAIPYGKGMDAGLVYDGYGRMNRAGVHDQWNGSSLWIVGRVYMILCI